MILILVQSCSTIESTVDSTLDSISEAGDFIYDSVNFWDEDEPEQSEAVIIEEAVEVPEYAIPDESYFEPGLSQEQNFSNQQSFQPKLMLNLTMTQFTGARDNTIMWDLMELQC